MEDWLKQINPNVVIPIVVSLAGWLWHQVRGDKKQQTEQHRSVLDDIVENFIYELLDKYPLGVDVETYLKNSRGYIESKIWEVAQKRGIPKNKVTEALFHAALERGSVILAQEVARLRQMRSGLDK